MHTSPDQHQLARRLVSTTSQNFSSRLTLLAALLLGVWSCGDEGLDRPIGPERPVDSGSPPATLAEWKIFENDAARAPLPDVVPYEVVSPLFSDNAQKHRYLVLPGREKFTYRDSGVFDFPVGTILVKTFARPTAPVVGGGITISDDWVETRLLILTAEGWQPHTYVWNDEQTEATLTPGGSYVNEQWFDSTGAKVAVDFRIPSEGECRTCHATNTLEMRVLGVRSGMLDRDGVGPLAGANQLTWLAEHGYMLGEPTDSRERMVNPADSSKDVHDRARSYMSSNCGHCHSEVGNASTSAGRMRLDFESLEPMSYGPTDWGACQRAGTAGGACPTQNDVVPGCSASSLVVCRVERVSNGMPPLGRSINDPVASEVLRAWVDTMPPASCTPSECSP